MDVVATLDIKNAAFGKWETDVAGNELVQAMAKAPFTPTLALVTGDVAIADFMGYTSQLTVGGGTRSARNAAEGGRDVVMRGDPDKWLAKTTGTTGLPQTMYGLIVSDGVTNQIYCARVFDPPIPITGLTEGAPFDLKIFTYFDSVLK